jgi:hypothetical protein
MLWSAIGLARASQSHCGCAIYLLRIRRATATVTAEDRIASHRIDGHSCGLGFDEVELSTGAGRTVNSCAVQLLETYKQFDWCVPLMQGAVQVRPETKPPVDRPSAVDETRRDNMQRSAAYDAVQRSAACGGTAHHTKQATHAVQHKAAVQGASCNIWLQRCCGLPFCAHPRMNMLQHGATQCNTVQHVATQCSTVQHVATQYDHAVGLAWPAARGLPGSHA